MVAIGPRFSKGAVVLLLRESRDGHIVRTEISEISEVGRRKNILKSFFHQKTIAFLKRSRRELSQTYLGSNQLSKNVLKKVRASWVHFGNFATWEQKNQRNPRNLVHEMEALLGDWKSWREHCARLISFLRQNWCV